MKKTTHPTAARTALHWGGYDPEIRAGRLVAMRPIPEDPSPSPLGRSYVEAVDDALRIRQPMVRQSWLEHGPGHSAGSGKRGAEPFVSIDWDHALALVAQELTRVRDAYGHNAIYGGSYGWGSAERSISLPSRCNVFWASSVALFARSIRTVPRPVMSLCRMWQATSFGF